MNNKLIPGDFWFLKDKVGRQTDAIRKKTVNRFYCYSHSSYTTKGKCITSLLLIMSMIIAIMSSMTVMAASVPDTSWYISNPSAASFTITTADQLAGLVAIVNSGMDSFTGKTITLGNDIDLSAYSADHDSGQGWLPIGVQGNPFSGIFNGNNYKVRTLYVDRVGDGGLFGRVLHATIINLCVEDVYVRADNNTGGLIGHFQQSTIINCYATGIVIGTESVGGLIGTVESGVVSSCSFSGLVNGTLNVGGLIGNAIYETEVLNCFSSGSVNGKSNAVGGLIGQAGFNGMIGVSISDSYSITAVKGSSHVGGLVGSINAYSAYGSIINSAALNPTVQGGNLVDRVAGESSSNYFYGNVALRNISSGSGSVFSGANTHDELGGADITLAQALMTVFWTTATPTWTAWDTDVWHITDGALPTLKMNSAPIPNLGNPTLIVSHAKGNPGDEVEITVSLINNHGIAGFNLALEYDRTILTPLSATKNPALGGSIFASNANEVSEKSTLNGVITAVWSSSYNVDIVELFTIRFQINGDFTSDDDFITPVEVHIQDMKYLTRQDVSANRKNGSVTVLFYTSGDPGTDSDLWGDTNVDGVVDINDLIRFAKHLAGIPNERLTDRGLYLADVDRNGRVDLGDLILLTQYLQSVDLNSPDVILGVPQ